MLQSIENDGVSKGLRDEIQLEKHLKVMIEDEGHHFGSEHFFGDEFNGQVENSLEFDDDLANEGELFLHVR